MAINIIVHEHGLGGTIIIYIVMFYRESSRDLVARA